MEKKCRVGVIDSQWAVMAQGFKVIEVARAAADGASLDKVIEVARETMSRVDLRASFDILDYLRRGGHIGWLKAFPGSILRVNPLIILSDGSVKPAGRACSRAKAIDRLYDFAMSHSHIEAIAVEDAAYPDDAYLLAERLGSKFPTRRIYRIKTTPVIGRHTKPSLLLLPVLGDKN